MALAARSYPGPLANRHAELSLKLAGAGVGWLDTLRADSAARYRATGLPTPKVEAWRYTNLKDLVGIDFASAPVVGDMALDSLPRASLLAVNGHVLAFVNGRLRPDLSTLDTLPAGVTLLPLSEAIHSDEQALSAHLGRLVEAEENPFVDLNTALMEDGVVLRLADGAVLDKPLHIISVGAVADTPLAFFPRLLAVLGRDARATIFESHAGIGEGAYLSAMASEIVLGAGAHLEHYKLQNESQSAFHVANTRVTVEAGAVYDNFVLQIGSRLSRNEVHTALIGEGASCRLNGAYLGAARQHLDSTTFIDHAVPGCASREVYKGVLDDQAHGVFQGKILVRRDAQQTDGHQLNRALLLSRQAEVNAKPELEIYADDVKCSHGATVGELADDQLFYLQARGIDRETARGLLIEAYVQEALDEIGNAEARLPFQRLVGGWLKSRKG
ncbi:MAG: Fe-S cluster assembly protein SufD [Alphaproteobacteria bacterium]|nr:Fe-S cluster assembly protein SufD [Alphaproteobacteria bacterium]